MYLFVNHCLVKNRPAIIKSVGVEWEICRIIKRDGVSKGILSLFGGTTVVPVETTPTDLTVSTSYCCPRRLMTLDEFFSHACSSTEGGLYLKDWHPLLEHSQNQSTERGDDSKGREDLWFQLPDIFADDWLNWFYKVFPATICSGI